MKDFAAADGCASLPVAGPGAGLPGGGRSSAGAAPALASLMRAGRTVRPVRGPLAGAAAATLYRHRVKRVLDVAICVVAMPLILPLLLLAAGLLALECMGIFYSQPRIGRDGRTFRMLKLRTMVPQADALLEACLRGDPALRAEWDRTQKLKNDPRVTPIGRLLRRTSLDELPQVWHVLTGEMSLVGPRPMLPDQMRLYGPPRAYLALRPGITGLWQVTERNDSDFSSRARADRRYERSCSFLTDMKLILLTIGAVARGTGH